MNILFVHQSADLYGSDKVLLDLVTRLPEHGIHPIVLIPVAGPLLEVLQEQGIETHICPVLKLSRASMRPMGFLRFLAQVPGVLGAIDSIVAGRKIDLVHSNTLAVLAGACWSRRRGVKHAWHLHETISAPKAAAVLFPWLVRLFADQVICNSRSTRDWLLSHQPVLVDRVSVILNGVAAPDFALDSPTAKPAGLPVIGLVGRINRMKGHALLIEAAERLAAQGVSAFRLLFVGSPPPGQEHFLQDLQQRIDVSPIAEKVELRGFSADIWHVWQEVEIACVPSLEPESFGLVAVEAMASGLPVVAAAHGGVLEIVRDDESGWLFTPGDVEALAEKLKQALAEPERRSRLGSEGRRLYRESFSIEAMMRGFVTFYRKMVE